MAKILVSACLLGECTRYDGKNNFLGDPIFLRWKEQGLLVPVCPEVLGGLPTPRPPSEISGCRVINERGEDVTSNFEQGADAAVGIAKQNNVAFAIMKQSSPSCGSKTVYNGNFDGTKIAGMGICVRKLTDNGIRVFDENEIDSANLFLIEFEESLHKCGE